MTTIDDISHMRLCERCHRWGPEKANFCGQCGFQRRPIPFPVAPFDAQAHCRRRRLRRGLAVEEAGWVGLFGSLIGEHIHESRVAAERKGDRR